MGSVVAELLPMILGAALAPAWIMIVLLLLANPGGLAKAAAFVLGMTLTRLLQGVIFGLVFGGAAGAGSSDSSPIAATLLLVIGILLLVAAYRKWAKVADPDDPPPQWMQSLDQIAPLKALALGAGLVAIGVKLWVFTLTALDVIAEAELTRPERIVAYLLYIALAQLLLLAPILIVAVAPQTTRGLQRATDLLTRYNRPISIGVSLVFGLYFTWKGISGLRG